MAWLVNCLQGLAQDEGGYLTVEFAVALVSQGERAKIDASTELEWAFHPEFDRSTGPPVVGGETQWAALAGLLSVVRMAFGRLDPAA